MKSVNDGKGRNNEPIEIAVVLDISGSMSSSLSA